MKKFKEKLCDFLNKRGFCTKRFKVKRENENPCEDYKGSFFRSECGNCRYYHYFNPF